MKKLLPIIAIGMLLLVSLACGGTSGPSEPSSSGTTLTLVNDSSATVCYVYISPTTDDSWGDDQLGDTETISPGSQRTFNLTPGTYDLRADDCSNNTLDTQWEVEINGNIDWTLSD